MRPTAIALLTGLLLVPAPALAQKAPKRERNRLSLAELAQAADRYAILYDAIRNLRPHFLAVNNRGVRTLGLSPGAGPGAPVVAGEGGSRGYEAKAVVYVHGTKSGDPEILKNLSTNLVEEVRYFTANEAESEYGPNHEGGVIAVKLIQRP